MNNYATQGGAIYVDAEVKNVNNSTSLVNQCVVYNNAAGERAAVENAGGGLYLAGEATVVNSSIFNNENGGLRLADGAKVVNSTVSRNSSGGIDMIDDKPEDIMLQILLFGEIQLFRRNTDRNSKIPHSMKLKPVTQTETYMLLQKTAVTLMLLCLTHRR